MSDYIKLTGESFDFDFEDIQGILKRFHSKMKEFQRSNKKGKELLYQELEKLQNQLQEIFNRPRPNISDKPKLETLEKQFKGLSLNFTKIKSNFEKDSELNSSGRTSHDDIFDKIIEDESLAFQNITAVREKQYLERKEDVDKLHKDFVTVNEIFQDSAKMINEQGRMLAETENNIAVAVEQTDKGGNEIDKANAYQESARKKLWCLCIIVIIIIVVLLAIIFGVVYK